MSMDFSTFTISIICIYWLTVEGFPQQNNERLEPRGVGDYMSSWFWSSEENNVNVPTVDHLEEKSNVIKSDKNSKSSDNSPGHDILSQTNQGFDHNSIAEEIKPVDELPKGAELENVDALLEQLKEDVINTHDQEKTETLRSLWKDLTDTVSETSSPYVEVVYKNARHIIDIGPFGSSKRSRCFTEMGSSNPFAGLMQLLSSILGLYFGGARNNLGISGFPAAISSSNAGAISSAGAGAVPGVNFVSIQDILRMKQGQQPPNLGGGSVVTPDVLGNLLIGGGSQTAPTQPADQNTSLLIAMLLKLLSNNGNGSRGGGGDIDLDILSKLPKGSNNNSDLINIIKKIRNPSGASDDDDDENSSSRIIVLKTSDLEDLDGSGSGKNPFEIINIRGTPKQRFKRIKRKFENNPDSQDKIVIVNELSRLKNDPSIDSDLRKLILSLERDIENDDEYDDIRRKFSKLTGGKSKLGNLGDIQFIDGRKNKLSRSFSSGDDDEELWKELVQSLSPKFKSKRVSDSKTFKDLLNELNIKNFDMD
ncbi:uncharacterized protein LOC135844940 [Planococcus citri]|uniref:uncharacterized protein LOC135844940 n=1 Tax=Planococcus citri TaxID=170843 RepID=UPI0031F979FF